jgi:hypothetical protein
MLASAAHYPIVEKEEEEGCSFSKERTFQSRDESQQIAVW